MGCTGLAYFLYNLLLLLGAPLILPYSSYRAVARGMPGDRVRERFGVLPLSVQQTAGESIWLHAVSVGEAIAATPLVEQLRRRFPDVPIFVSTTTATGQQIAEEKLSAFVNGIFYSPLDYSFMVRRVLRTLRPRLVIVLETEIWPNLFRLSKAFGAGLMVVNGRISDQSADRYVQSHWFFSKVLEKPDLIFAQSELDRSRFVGAGAPDEKVRIGGNLKYDFEPAESAVPVEIAAFLDGIKPETIILAGSTREREEEPVVRAFQQVVEGRSNALLVVAPRHPARFEEADRILESSGLPVLRRSELENHDPAQTRLPAVLLLDSLGELSSLYRVADVVFVGGSLNGWGGHNVLEPAHFGRPIIVGPYMQNFREMTDDLLSEKAIMQIKGAEGLLPAFQQILNDAAFAEELGSRAREVAERSRGAAARAVEEAERFYRSAVPRKPRSAWRAVLLKPLALLWEAGARVRRQAYESGYLKTRQLETFTLCVGNITAGGTGKTPLVLWLLDQFHQRGLKAAVMLRGYRRAEPQKQTIVRAAEEATPASTGDEAQVILRHLQREEIAAPIGIGANRYRVARRLEAVATPDVLLMDDGFQHSKLQRDLDLVLIDVTDPFGGEEMLPLGRLREPLTSLGRASAFLLTRTEREGDYSGLEDQLLGWAPGTPVFRSRLEAVGLVDPSTGKELPLSSAEGRRLVAFCGLGNPEPFWRMVAALGPARVERIEFPDHRRYSARDVAKIRLVAQQQRAHLVVTTEKDFVNLWHAAEQARPAAEAGVDAVVTQLFGATPLAWLRVKAAVDEPDRLLDWIEERMARSSQRPTEAARGQALPA